MRQVCGTKESLVKNQKSLNSMISENPQKVIQIQSCFYHGVFGILATSSIDIIEVTSHSTLRGLKAIYVNQISDSHTCSSYVLMKTVYVTGPNKQRLYTIIVMNSYFRYD